MLGGELLQDAFFRGRVAGGGFGDDRQVELFEEDFAELLRGVDVELLAGELEDVRFDRFEALFQPLRNLIEHAGVEPDAGVLHRRKDVDEREFDVAGNVEHVAVLQAPLQFVGEAEGNVGVLAGVRGGLGHIHLAHGVGGGLVADEVRNRHHLVVEHRPGDIVEIVGLFGRHQVMSHHGVEKRTAHLQPMLREQ